MVEGHDSMKHHDDAVGSVKSAYAKFADEFETHGNRFNIGYLLNKAMVDWRLLEYIRMRHGFEKLREMKVLNVGCSEPIDEIFMSDIFGGWTAVDFSPQSIRSAEGIVRKELSEERSEKIHLTTADATSLPFPDGSFDVVVSYSALEHIPDPAGRRSAIREISRVLKDDGYAAITMPNKYSGFYFTHKRLMKENASNYGYAHLYTPVELELFLSCAGLKPFRFASEYEMMNLPRILEWLFSPLRLFGSRIGFLCVKTQPDNKTPLKCFVENRWYLKTPAALLYPLIYGKRRRFETDRP